MRKHYRQQVLIGITYLQAPRADSSESGPMANGSADAAKDTPMEVREVSVDSNM